MTVLTAVILHFVSLTFLITAVDGNPEVTSTTVTTPQASASTVPAPSTPKPEQQQESAAIFSIRTIDFSKRKKETVTPKPVDTCFSNDMCQSMPGICHKGTCMTKKCSTDIFCLCEPGFTGQFCDRNVTEVQKVDVKIVNGKIVETPVTTPVPNSKEQMNENTKQVSNNANATSVNSSKNVDTGLNHVDNNGTKTQSKNIKAGKATSNKPAREINIGAQTHAQNGNPDGSKLSTLNNSEKNMNSDSYISSGGTSAKNVGSSGSKKGKRGKSNEKRNAPNVKSEKVAVNAGGSIQRGNLKSSNSHVATNNQNAAGEKVVAQDSLSRSKPDVITQNTPQTTRARTSDMGGRDDRLTPKTEIFSDGSYRKGPESTVRSDNSPVPFTAFGHAVRTNKPAIIERTSDVVKMPSMAVHNTNVGMMPGFQLPGSRKRKNKSISRTSEQRTNKTASSESQKQNGDNTGKGLKDANIAVSSEIKNVADDGSAVNKDGTDKENTVAKGSDSSVNVVSTTETLEKAKDVILSQNSGSVDVSNDMLTGHAVFDNKEVMITIEKTHDTSAGSIGANTDVRQGKELSSKDKNVPKQPSNFRQFEVNRKSIQKLLEGSNGASSDVDANANNLTAPGGEDKGVKRNPKETTSSQPQTESINQSEPKNTNATETNPLLQLLNIIGSREFVDHVSAVKIEIITKSNSTEKISKATLHNQDNTLSASQEQSVNVESNAKVNVQEKQSSMP